MNTHFLFNRKENINFMKYPYLFLTIFTFNQTIFSQQVSTFEEIPAGPTGYIDGSDGSGGFVSGEVFFPNLYDDAFGYWAGGWALSAMTDSTTSGFGNLFSAKTAGGVNGSPQYAIGQQQAVAHTTGAAVAGLFVSNTTYAYNSMRDGDTFAKKFGGPTGEDPDFFKLTVRAYLGGELQPDSAEFFLADYRFADPAQDYLIDSWVWFDLSGLGAADSLLFTLSSSDVGPFGINTPLFFAIDNLINDFGGGPFAPAADQPGTTAVPASDSLFWSFVEYAEVERGFLDIADPALGLASAGEAQNALGAPDGLTLSLGDGGIAVLETEWAFENGEGWDLVIFENSFNHSFLELAKVEVSQDGSTWYAFPSVSLTDTLSPVGSFGAIDPTRIHNLAGKYKGGYGTPFDLSDLEGLPGGEMSFFFIRITDVVGTLDPDLAYRDSDGRMINDPYPTPFESGGFDLDAAGVRHIVGRVEEKESQPAFAIHPNPAGAGQSAWLDAPQGGLILIFDIWGREVFRGEKREQAYVLPALEKGVYWVQLNGKAVKWAVW